MSFGNRLKDARIRKKLSQQELAKRLSITDGTVSNYEKGVAFPRWDKIKLLCEILEVDPNYLFWDDLSDNLKASIILNSEAQKSDKEREMYNQLDEIDRAEIRGEIKAMLKAPKYQTSAETMLNDITEEISSSLNTLVKNKIQD